MGVLMPKYGSFNPSVPEPSPITGWYDTDFADYPNLPTTLYEMNDDEWAARLNGFYAISGGQLVSYTPPTPPPTADQVYAQKVADGITITSTSNSALNGTYPIDSASFAQTGAIARDASSGLGLPHDTATVAINDTDGNPHNFDEASVIALYKAERNLLSTLGTQRDVMAGGGEPVWPPQSATIP